MPALKHTQIRARRARKEYVDWWNVIDILLVILHPPVACSWAAHRVGCARVAVSCQMICGQYSVLVC